MRPIRFRKSWRPKLFFSKMRQRASDGALQGDAGDRRSQCQLIAGGGTQSRQLTVSDLVDPTEHELVPELKDDKVRLSRFGIAKQGL